MSRIDRPFYERVKALTEDGLRRRSATCSRSRR